MARIDCPDCQVEVDKINRAMLEAGQFTANSAFRDGEMRQNRLELLANPTVGCGCQKEGEVTDE